MSDSIYQLLQDLPSSSMTTRVLGGLDYLVPGSWQNITNFEEMIANETGESDQALLQAVGEKAIALYADESTGYQRAVRIYKLVDSGATMAGVTSMAAKLGEDVSWLSFLGSVTPKAETSQGVDAALKFAAEISAFCSTNGLPGDSIGDFVSALTSAAKEDRMRMAAWLALDCVLPLGPEFFNVVRGAVTGAIETVENSALYQRVGAHLHGGSAGEKRDFIVSALDGASGWISSFTSGNDVSQGSVLSRVQGFIDGAEGKMDYAAAILDMSTNVFEHTGIQTVARRSIRRAYGEI